MQTIDHAVDGTITKQPNLPNTNRTGVVFGSVRCGAELEQTEQGPILFCSFLFVRLAISDHQIMRVLNENHICTAEANLMSFSFMLIKGILFIFSVDD